MNAISSIPRRLFHLGGEKVTIENPGGHVQNPDGTFTIVTNPPVPVDGCLFAPASSEVTMDANHVLEVHDTPQLFLPPGVDVEVGAVVVVRGEAYQVVETPQRWSSPVNGAAVGVVVKIQKVEG